MRPPNADAAMAALTACGIDVSRETAERYLVYFDLLLQWQPKINLISPTTLPTAWQRHFIDSAQILPLIPAEAEAVTDLGSGGGFPGLIVALARPDIAVTFVESDTRKCAFLSTVARATGIKIIVSNMRIEKHVWARADIITARALAHLSTLVDYSIPAFTNNGNAKAVFLKGGSWPDEVAQLAKTHPMFHVEHRPSLTDPESAVLTLTRLPG